MTDDSAAGKPEISLIVCTLGRSKELTRLLTSFAAQTFRDFEIILVDQNPEGFLDSTIGPFQGRLRIGRVTSQKGLSKARNVGLRHARANLIGFPDDDCWYEPGVIEQVVGYFARNPDADILLGRTVDAAGRNSNGTFRDASGPVSKWNFWVSGNSNTLFARAGVSAHVGGFDENLGVGAPTKFQSGEEADFVLTALRLGMSAYYDNDLLIYHEQVDSEIGEKQIARAHGYAAGFGRILKKHRYGLAYLFYRTGRLLVRSLLEVLRFNFPMARHKMIWAVETLRYYFKT